MPHLYRNFPAKNLPGVARLAWKNRPAIGRLPPSVHFPKGIFAMFPLRSTTLVPCLAIAILASSGCVERRVTIRTNPPGALCYIDDNEVGITPVSTPFIYYGDRKIRLVKDGYETQTFIQPMPTPWYEIPPLDFFAETMVPGNIRDQRTFDYPLRPQGVVPKEQLLGRAENLRRGTQSLSGIATPGFRVNPPSGPGPYAPPNMPGAVPMGAQPIQQFPTPTYGPTTGMTPPPAYNPPVSTQPPAPIAPGPIVTPPLSNPPSNPAYPYQPLTPGLPPEGGSLPSYPLPPGR